MTKQLYFHGSPKAGLKELSKDTYITTDIFTAYVMGMNYNGRTWSDEDLEEPYKFGSGWPKFKDWPRGEVHIYQIWVGEWDIDYMNNPWEHRTKKRVKVTGI